ncbi:MAG: glycoside hydrolase family 99-like domain-containing protein [Candidatus Omnitrophica bacterium]|nr:glycoside hydrolase family 99-like domain-containing protein [Candidatus Omnitrophota bacterium]
MSIRNLNSLKARLIAFYLPQFHPIPENDEWWGKGFTEWTNVAKAKPLFRRHRQPRVPSDLGFYDLRVPETRIAQAELAKAHGLEGFCYWHYWFGGGKRLLERPFNEVLKTKEPDFPFCLGWANQPWTGVWHGCPDRILMEQTYPGLKDYEAHFNSLREAFFDERYIKVDGKPLFVVFKPRQLPKPRQFSDLWRHLSVKAGLKGLFFIGHADPSWSPNEHGFDASIIDMLPSVLEKFYGPVVNLLDRISFRQFGRDFRYFYRRLVSRPSVYSYRSFIKHANFQLQKDLVQFPCVIPNWDNTPRSGIHGTVLNGSTPKLFQMHLRDAIQQVVNRKLDKRVVFVKSWNEWAEGNYLEPDHEFGRAYLEVIKAEIISSGSVAEANAGSLAENASAPTRDVVPEMIHHRIRS